MPIRISYQMKDISEFSTPTAIPSVWRREYASAEVIGMEIREVQLDDIGKIIGLINDNYDFVMAEAHSKAVLEKFKSHNTIENWINQMKWKRIFVVEEGDEIIATGSLADFGDQKLPKVSISNFFVAPHKQGTGVGRFLATHLKEIASKMGAGKLHVPSSRTGFSFYSRLGFMKDDIQDDDKDEIIWMTMLLPPPN